MYAPNPDTYIFCRVRGEGAELAVALEEADEPTILSSGEIHVVRYPPVQALVGHQLDLI